MLRLKPEADLPLERFGKAHELIGGDIDDATA